MSEKTLSRMIGDLSYAEVPKRLSKRSILCLPIGSIEQHGPHLPLNTDAILAEAFTRRIIARWAETYDLWQLPTLALGLAREHEWAPGTLSLSVESITTLMHDLGRSIVRALPSLNLAIINAHGGNRGILEALAQDLRADCGLNVCIMHPAVWAAEDDTGTPDFHGGKSETSMMLAIAPHLVDSEQMRGLKASPASDTVRATIVDPAVTWPWTSDEPPIAALGVIGDAKAASAEEGERLLARIAERAGGVLRQLLDRMQLVER